MIVNFNWRDDQYKCDHPGEQSGAYLKVNGLLDTILIDERPASESGNIGKIRVIYKTTPGEFVEFEVCKTYEIKWLNGEKILKYEPAKLSTAIPVYASNTDQVLRKAEQLLAARAVMIWLDQKYPPAIS